MWGVEMKLGKKQPKLGFPLGFAAPQVARERQFGGGVRDTASPVLLSRTK